MKYIRILVLFIAFLIVSYYGLDRSQQLQTTVEMNKVPSGSTIAGKEVGKLAGDQLKSALYEWINEWASEPITVTGSDTSLNLDISSMQYNVDATVNTYEQLTTKPWYMFWKKPQTAHLSLQMLDNEALKQKLAEVEEWDVDATYEKVIYSAIYLGEHTIQATEKSDYQLFRIAMEEQQIPSAAKDADTLLALLDGQKVLPNQLFSLVELVNREKVEANSDALNYVASMLYSVSLKSNSKIIARSSQQQPPNYLQLGIEAAITLDGKKDLQFINTLSQAMTFKASVEGNRFRLEAYSTEAIDEVKLRVVTESEIKPRIIVRYSNKLAAGQTQLIDEGRSGSRIYVIRTNTATKQEERISRDYYPPQHRVELHSTRSSLTSQGQEALVTMNQDASTQDSDETTEE